MFWHWERRKLRIRWFSYQEMSNMCMKMNSQLSCWEIRVDLSHGAGKPNDKLPDGANIRLDLQWLMVQHVEAKPPFEMMNKRLYLMMEHNLILSMLGGLWRYWLHMHQISNIVCNIVWMIWKQKKINITLTVICHFKGMKLQSHHEKVDPSHFFSLN